MADQDVTGDIGDGEIRLVETTASSTPFDPPA